MHNKLNLYIPNKKVTNHSFITSIRNVIENYEIKKEKIIRHDYVTKSLICYSKSIKKNKYNWLDYDTFKNIEQKIIKEENNKLEVNNINNIISIINKLDLNENKVDDIKLNEKDNDSQSDSKFNNINNSSEKNNNDEISMDSDNYSSNDDEYQDE